MSSSTTIKKKDDLHRHSRLGVGADGMAGEKNLHDADFTISLFRFCQLLCEGHNLEFQNYLRLQAGSNTNVNIIICTVDYLLSLQVRDGNVLDTGIDSNRSP